MTPCVNCPEPDFCNLLGYHMHGRSWDIYRGFDGEGKPVNLTSEQCEKYRAMWAAAIGITTDDLRERFGGGDRGIVASTDCIHRGATIRKHKCESCGGGWSAPIKTCSIHGECTLFSKSIEGVMQCPCPDQQLREKPFRRNLIYYLYPRKNNGMWQWNVKELLKRIDQFDGKRVVAISWDVRCTPADEVKAAFKGEIPEENFILRFNKTPIGEVNVFRQLLERVKSTDEDDITFYAHSKGVIRGTPYGKLWGGAMYETCLDYPKLVERHLQASSMTGSFRKTGGFDVVVNPHQNWHYSGTFYWFRNKDVFSRKWTNIGRFYGGTECWPGMMFRRNETSCLFHDLPRAPMLYDVGYWDRFVTNHLQEWKHSNAHYARKGVHE